MANIKAKFDLAIIGGGIIGLATARQVSIRHPKLKVCVLEKEKELASHQSKRNSGVVHCGIYYKKGSLKSRFCIKGARAAKEYCLAKKLPYIQCGKLIVATKQQELETLNNLHASAIANNIQDIELITPAQVERIQPGCSKTLEAIWSPNTAIVSWQDVALSYASDFELNGGTILKGFTANSFRPTEKRSILIDEALNKGDIEAKSVVNCAGLFSDYFARQTGNNEHPKVVPFKGNYHMLSDRLANTIKTNIYPVPNPKVPFLGVHITPRIDGSVLVGPTALLSLGYENYEPDASIRLIYLYHILWRSGFSKMLRKDGYFKAGLLELWRLFSKGRLASEAREFLPDLKTTDLIDTNFCGIRAQVVGSGGELVDDFLFERGANPELDRVLHLRNCPSPAATSSLAIAERVVDILEERM